MKELKILVLLAFIMFVGGLNLSQAYADDRYLLLASSDTATIYLDKATFSVTKDKNNMIYYDVWIKQEYQKDVPELNLYTREYENLDIRLYHMVFIVTDDKIKMQIRSITDYGKSGAMLFTNTIIKPSFSDIGKNSMAEELANRISEYISKSHIQPIAVLNEKYLPLDEKGFYNLFETNGYKLNEIEEAQGPNIFNDYTYSSSTTPYSYLNKVINKEIQLSISGVDKQHLKRAFISFHTEGPNDKQSEIVNLPSEEKLNLFYMTLQALFPDWSQSESKNWVNTSIERMNQSNTVMFIYLHKDKEYIMISRQPVEDDKAISYILEVSQSQPSVVNPIRTYYERSDSICIYEEWHAK